MSVTGPYQEFDPLSPEEFAALESLILKDGVLVPIIVDEEGRTIDGHHRRMICEKHGIEDYPVEVKHGLTDDEKRDMAQTLNIARRHMSREEKQRQIRNRLKRNPDHSDRRTATALGCDHKTVAKARKGLVEGGEIPHVTEKIGAGGMRYVPPSPRKTTDAAGGEIPQRLASAFTSRPEHTAVVNVLLDVKRRLGELGHRSPGVRAKLSALHRHIDGMTTAIQQSVPHAVHMPCSGDGCDDCGMHGFVMGGEHPQQD